MENILIFKNCNGQSNVQLSLVEQRSNYWPALSLVADLSLADETIESIAVSTQNTSYCFIYQGSNEDGHAIWLVLDGRADMIGKYVHLMGINEKNSDPLAIKT